MKFTAGYWEIRPGVTPTYPVQVHEVEVDGKGMTVVAATKALNHRGDTLNLPLLTIRYTSPMRDVIRVQACHHKGGLGRGPSFELNQEPVQTAVTIENGARLTVEVPSADGATTADLRVERSGNQLSLAWDGSAAGWKAVLHDPALVHSIQGGTVQGSSQGGQLLVPTGRDMTVHL